MKRIPVLLCALSLLSSACGNGNKTAPQQAAPSVKQSRLVAFEPGDLAADMQFPDFTPYWTLAEQRNGNVFPINAGVNDDGVLAVRLGGDGELADNRGGTFQGQSLAGVGSRMQALAKENYNESQQATGAALLLFADKRAPYVTLLELCNQLVNLQVRNLWLVTHDDRGDALRLLPLKVDTQQVFNDWYNLPDDEASVTVRVQELRNDDGTPRVELAWATDLTRKAIASGKDWPRKWAKSSSHSPGSAHARSLIFRATPQSLNSPIWQTCLRR